MRLLAFDTSAASVSVSLMDAGSAVFARVWEPRATNRQESVTTLVPALDAALAEAGWAKCDLDAVAVGTGPGSFTGIRAGVVTARTIAQSLDIALLPVSLFECYARSVEREAAFVLAGSQGHFFAAAYRGPEVVLRPPSYLSLADMEKHLAGIDLWLSDPQALRSLSDSGIRSLSLPVYENIASIEAQIAWDRLSLKVPPAASRGGRESLRLEFSWRLVEPLYVRGPSVTIKKTHGHSHSANDSG